MAWGLVLVVSATVATAMLGSIQSGASPTRRKEVRYTKTFYYDLEGWVEAEATSIQTPPHISSL